MQEKSDIIILVDNQNIIHPHISLHALQLSTYSSHFPILQASVAAVVIILEGTF